MQHLRFLILSLVILATSVAAAETRTILLVTESGIFLCQVENGVPGPFVPQPKMDVIVHGIDLTPKPPSPPTPPAPKPEDPVVQQIAGISRSLKNKEEATAIAAIIHSLQKANVSADDFVQALEMSVRIADVHLLADGRAKSWVQSALAITKDPTKLKAGLISAWDIDLSVLGVIQKQVDSGTEAAVTGEAIPFVTIIELIQMLIALLTKLGVIK